MGHTTQDDFMDDSVFQPLSQAMPAASTGKKSCENAANGSSSPKKCTKAGKAGVGKADTNETKSRVLQSKTNAIEQADEEEEEDEEEREDKMPAVKTKAAVAKGKVERAAPVKSTRAAKAVEKPVVEEEEAPAKGPTRRSAKPIRG